MTPKHVGLALLVVAALVGRARAQDFTPASPAGPSASPAALIERGLPLPGGAAIEASTTSWLGVPGLVTRGLAAVAGVGSVRAAAGWSQTGEPGSGWMSAGLAAGASGEGGGIALRGVVRRDLDPSIAARERYAAEAGGGAWLAAASHVRVWARAPEVVTTGTAPPLARGLAAGVSVEHDGVGAWFEHESPARRDDESGVHAAGVWLKIDPARVWIEGRSRPLRAGFGIAVGGLAVRAMGHPRLGDTVTLSLALPPRIAP